MKTFLDGLQLAFVFIILPALGNWFIEFILQEDKKMNNYNIMAHTEKQKYNIINIIRDAGAVLTGVSACGSSYYIQLDATPAQATEINFMLGGV